MNEITMPECWNRGEHMLVIEFVDQNASLTFSLHVFEVKYNFPVYAKHTEQATIFDCERENESARKDNLPQVGTEPAPFALRVWCVISLMIS